MAHTWWHVWGEIGERAAQREAWIGPNAPEDSPFYFRVPEFKALRGKTEYTKPIPLDKLPNTPSVTGDLISEYNKTKRTAERKINVEGYGEGRLVASGQYKGKIYFYPTEANRAHDEAVKQDFADYNALQTTFTTLAGPAGALAGARSTPSHVVLKQPGKTTTVPVSTGGRTFRQQRQYYKYRDQYNRVTAGMDAKNVTPQQTPVKGEIPKNTSALSVRTHTQRAGLAGPEGKTLQRFNPQEVAAMGLGQPFAYSKEAGPKNTIWRVDGLADKKKFMSEVVKPWVNENKQALMTKDLKRTALGTVFYNNELYRIQGLSEHLATSGKAKLNLIRVGQDASRKYQLDPSTIQVVTDYLDTANKGFIDSKGELGVNPKHLNAAIFRKSIKKGAGLMDKITSELGKLFKQNLDKEHAFGALSSEGFGHDDYVSQFSGDRAFNIRLRKLNAFIQSQADALGIPGKGILPNSKKIHPRRAAMEEQYGWLQSVTNRAMKARELGDNPFTAELKDLTRQYGTLVQGSTKGVGQVPGNPLSMAEMVKLQQRGLKGDKQAAVETILAERDVLNKAIEAGLAEEPDTIAILKKYLTNIDIDQQIITAKKDAAKRLKEEKTYKYEGRSLGHYPKEKFKRLPRAEPKGKTQPRITESMWKALKDWELIYARSNRPWINK